MIKLTKSMLGAGAAAAALAGVAAPAAQARDHRGDGIGAGEIIAGAVILGGLAAVIASSDNDRNRGYDYRRDGRYDDGRYDDGRYNRGGGYGYDYNRYGDSRQAVNQCINQVERWAGRYARSDVTRINDIDRTSKGYKIKGNIVVQDGWRGRDRNGRYDRDYRNGYGRGYDQGSFTCKVEYGRVVDVDYKGLDRWR